MDSRSNLAIKSDAALRFFMVNTLSKILPLYIVTEYPKSGGSWLSQMISAYLDIPFPRNRYPKLEVSLMHGHMPYSPFMSNVLCLHRDGRDIMVSLYYHSLFQNDKNSPLLVERMRSSLKFTDYDDITSNLPKFMEFVFERDAKSKSPFRFTWPSFVQGWHDSTAIALKYESLISDGVNTLQGALRAVTKDDVDLDKLTKVYETYSFRNQSNRESGNENTTSFLRKGQPGDWINKFDKRSAILFNELAGDELILLGYEKDDSWIDLID
jgi:hypothetical protein